MLFLFSGLLWTGAAAAVNSQSLDEIRATVKHFVQQNYKDLGEISEIEIRALDPRLNLPACETPLEAFPLGHRRRLGNITVGVRCASPKPWKVYVPARVVSRMMVLTAAGPLPRGSVLKESDLRPISQEVAALPQGFYTRPQDLIGMELRRPLRPGEVISPAAVQARSLVQRGQTVMLVAEDGSVSVSMKGEALADGAAGERIQVRNLSSRRVIEGEVLDGNRVRIAL